MSGGNRHDRSAPLALGLVLGAIVLVAGISTFGERLRQPIAANDENSEPRHYDDAEYHIWGDSWAQWGMAAFALIAVGVSWRGLYLLRRTFEETKRTADLALDANSTAREIGEAQVRAYLAAEGGAFDIREKGVSYEITLKNVGHSPATNIRIRCIVDLQATGVRPVTSFSSMFAGINTIGAGSAEVGHAHYNNAGNPEWFVSPTPKDPLPSFPSSAFEDLREGKHVHFELRATVGWDDVFGRRQNQTFSFSEDATSVTTAGDGGRVTRREGRLTQGRTESYLGNVKPKA